MSSVPESLAHGAASSGTVRTGRRILAPIAAVLFSISLSACHLWDKTPAPADSRYQLSKDSGGRLVRLDTVTGEVTIVEGGTIQAHQTPRRAEPVTLKDEQPPATNAPVQTPAVPLPPTVVDDPCPLITGPLRVGIILTEARVFIRPRELQTPLATLANATRVSMLERSGEWVLVRFEDRRWGPRVGYVRCSAVRAAKPDIPGRLAVSRAQQPPAPPAIQAEAATQTRSAK